MTGLAGAGAGPRERNRDAEAQAPHAPDFHRLSIYMACLGLSFALLLAVGPREAGGLVDHARLDAVVFWAMAGFSVFGMIVGALAPAMAAGRKRDARPHRTPPPSGHPADPRIRRQGLQPLELQSLGLGRLVEAAVGVAAMLAVIAAVKGAPSGPSPAWPSVLVLLFAGRVLVEMADLRLWMAWRAPLDRRPAASVQSVGAALAFGGFLTLIFEQAAALASGMPGVRADFLRGMGDGAPTAGQIAVEALLGDTSVHWALIYLFFVVAAFIADAWRLHWRDRAALAALTHQLASAVRNQAGADLARPLPAALDRLVAAHRGNRALIACRTIADEADAAAQAAFRAATDFHLASRRFIRSIVPLLPLLGFVGTVIGLSITLGELPRDPGNGVRAAADISASLGGLAIKFQTTLLGLIGGMVASTALNVLEKAETELAAECALVVAAVAATASAVPPAATPSAD